MRFYSFIALLFIAITLDLAFLGLGLVARRRPLFEPHAALAAQPPSPTITSLPTPTSVSATNTPTATASPTSPPTATASATPTATSTPSPTATPTPQPQLLAAKSFAFTPSNKAVRANIRLALAHYDGALTHVVLAPGAVFSFNATLGARPQRLPWKDVIVKSTPAPAPTPADGAPAPTPAEPEIERIQGGGLCDLASRFVMAARPLLPARAFQFVNHVRSNGVHLQGVPTRDAVSIWAVGGGPGEQDLKITNMSKGWLEFVVEREGERITVTARLWDQAPPGW